MPGCSNFIIYFASHAAPSCVRTSHKVQGEKNRSLPSATRGSGLPNQWQNRRLTSQQHLPDTVAIPIEDDENNDLSATRSLCVNARAIRPPPLGPPPPSSLPAPHPIGLSQRLIDQALAVESYQQALTFSRGKKQTFMKVCTNSRSLSMQSAAMKAARQQRNFF